jgi:hypothetical protein
MTSGEPKKAGKAKWAGRRRPMTRKSGFSAHAAVEIEVVHVDGVHLDAGHEMVITFHLPEAKHKRAPRPFDLGFRAVARAGFEPRDLRVMSYTNRSASNLAERTP